MELPRGRGRGRARGVAPVQPGSQVPVQPGAQQQTALVQVGQRPLGRGRARGQSVGETGAFRPQMTQQPMQSDVGMGAGEPSVTAVSDKTQALSLTARRTGDGSGNGAVSLGRGSQRRQQELRVDLIRTKPSEMTKQGKDGDKIKLITNYYRMSKQPTWCLHQYHVDFNPEEDRTFMRKILLNPHKPVLGEFIFDGTVLYLLQYNKNGFQLASKRDTDGANVNILIKHTREIPNSDYQFLQFFNIIMRKCQGHLSMTLLGRNYYDSQNVHAIPEHGLELWPGYQTSIRQHEDNVLMCVDIAHRVLRTVTVWDLMQQCQQEQRGDPKKKVADILIGNIIITKYNNKTYKVDDIDWCQTPLDTFDKKGEKVSFVEYFKQTWNIRINYTNQPLLISRPKARDIHRGQTENVRLIPELCYLTGLDQSMRENFRLMKDVAVFTHPAADKRYEALKKFMLRLQRTDAVRAETEKWDLRFEQELETVDARVLVPETLYQKNGQLKYDRCDWTRSLQYSNMVSVVPLAQWAVITPDRESDAATNFVRKMSDNGRKMSMEIRPPVYFKLNSINTSAYLSKIDEVMRQMNPQLVMTVLPNNKKELYSAIKKKVYCDHGVASQAITARVIRNEKGMMSISTKVAIQLNCKLGGEPWTGKNPLKKAMVVGFDVYHDSPSRSASVGALVASYNSSLTKYYGVTASHKGLQELSDFMATKLVLAVQKYKQKNGELPEYIFIYRDGVGEGQVQHVVEVELKRVLEQLESFYGEATKIKLAFVIVTKRINARVFAMSGSSVTNPPAGTVIDSVITLPERYDFYLVSQRVTQGTVTPSAYNVVYDTTGLTPDRMQLFAYKLCHLYFNWTGTIRVPAPCQYAHKLAYLVGENLGKAPSSNMNEMLYYL